MLHTLTHSPFQYDFNAMLRMLASGDDVLLMQDGVLAALKGGQALEFLLAAPISLYVLRDDLIARGLSAQISHKAQAISYNEFVALVVKNPQQMTW
ncbi:sulfurtransferase complex subunit TusB [Erwinia oleae]|uniref:sulfurtransferase complex subunit TusB n=1 Tax=Erwinia oleae TaxID=796334 RepID=UPI00054D95F5|nr:sulfurtransferase complex subunit TusB [Erwinia oleae]